MAVEIGTPLRGQALPTDLPEEARVERTSGGPEDLSQMRIVIDLPPEAAREIKQLVHETGDALPHLIRKALGLYKLSKEAVREGKYVGITGTEDSLETEFVGF